MTLLPPCDYFQMRYYHQLSQFCEPSPAHFPHRSVNSHTYSHNSARGLTSRSVHVHSQRPRAERSSFGSQSKARKEQQMFRCWVQRNQDEVNRFPVFFQSQWKRECVSCPCVQECKVGQRRNQPGLWGQGQGGPQGGPQGRRWSS